MLQIDLWKRVLIFLVCVTGLILALPNGFYTRVEAHNDAVQAIELAGETPDRLAAEAGWPSWMPSSLVNLGLDLRGGAHLLAEVQVEDVYQARMEATWPEVRDALRPERDAVGGVRRQPSAPDEIRVRIGNPDGMARALDVVRDLAQPIPTLPGTWTFEALGTRADLEAVGHALYDTLRRLDDLGPDLIVVELTGAAGIGRAIDDRLTRAASGVVTGDEASLRQTVTTMLDD